MITTTRMMMTMMTKETILDELKHARNRYHQAQIIADQCCCERKDIIDLAEQNGIIIKKHLRRDWTKQEINQLEQMRSLGKGAYEISLKLGRTYGAVANKLSAMGLTNTNIYTEHPDCGGAPRGRLILSVRQTCQIK